MTSSPARWAAPRASSTNCSISRAVGVREPEVRWRVTDGVWFHNGVMTLVLRGRRAAVRVEHATVEWPGGGLGRFLTLVPGVGHTESYLASVDASAGRQVWQTSGGSTSGPTDQPAPTYDTLLAFLDEHLKR